MKKIKNTLIAILFCMQPAIDLKASVQIIKPSEAQQKFLNHEQQKIYVDVKAQKLHLATRNNIIIQSYVISTGRNGTGETPGSYKTPRGIFSIKRKIGQNNHPMLKYKAQRPVGIYQPSQARYDNILSRILTLDGLQKHNKNTLSRYVYIHGTSAIKKLGTLPCSLGCVRMNPYEITKLFDLVQSGTQVYIYDSSNPLPEEKNTGIYIKNGPGYLYDRRSALQIAQT